MISGDDIHVEVEPAYLGQDSQGDRYVFSSTITISNRGGEPAPRLGVVDRGGIKCRARQAL